MATDTKPTSNTKSGYTSFKQMGYDIVMDFLSRGFELVYPADTDTILETYQATLRPRAPTATNLFSPDLLVETQPWHIKFEFDAEPKDSDPGFIKVFVATPSQLGETGVVAEEYAYIVAAPEPSQSQGTENGSTTTTTAAPPPQPSYVRKSGELTCGWYVPSGVVKSGPVIPGVTDDHGNSWLNATPIGIDSITNGEMGIGDADVFVFNATDYGTITISYQGKEETMIDLLDDRGHVITTEMISGSETSFRPMFSAFPIDPGKNYYIKLYQYNSTRYGGTYMIKTVFKKREVVGQVEQAMSEEMLEDFIQKAEDDAKLADDRAVTSDVKTGPGGIDVTLEGQYTIPFASRFWALTNVTKIIECGVGVKTYSYQLVSSYQGIVLFIWEEDQDIYGNRFSWLVVQRPVSPVDGTLLVTGRCPVICMYSIGGGKPRSPNFESFLGMTRNVFKRRHQEYNDNAAIYYFTVREVDVTRPTLPKLASVDSQDSKAIINAKEQVVFVEGTQKYAIFFPRGFTTARYKYRYDLDLIAYTSADVIAHCNTISVSTYGENASRQYKGMLANLPYNRGMRILILTYGPGFDLPPGPSNPSGTVQGVVI